MKKLLVITFAFFAIVACEKVDENLIDSAQQDRIYDYDYKVTESEAVSYASSLSSDNSKILSIKSIEPIIYANDTLLYIINFKDKGWAVISGDKRTEPLLAFDELSNDELHKENLHDGLFAWLDEKAGLIYELKQTKPDNSAIERVNYWSSNEISKIMPPDGGNGYYRRVLVNTSTVTLPSYQVGPLLETKWGQGKPWNSCVPFGDAVNGLNPRCKTGCVAVATAQIMYFGHNKSNKPSWMYSEGSCYGYSWDGYKSYSFNFSSGSSSVWDEMRLTRGYNGYYGSSGSHEVAILMGYVGNKLSMDYGIISSSASSEDVPGVLNYFGITSNYRGYNYDKVISNLNNGNPVYSSASRTRKDHKFLGIHLYYTYRNGHAWVIDGYEDKKRKTTYTYRWEWVGDGNSDGYPPLSTVKKTTVDDDVYVGKIETYIRTYSTRYYIMNWGWNGSGDSGRYIPSGAWDGGLGDYKYKRNIICDFNF